MSLHSFYCDIDRVGATTETVILQRPLLTTACRQGRNLERAGIRYPCSEGVLFVQDILVGSRGGVEVPRREDLKHPVRFEASVVGRRDVPPVANYDGEVAQ